MRQVSMKAHRQEPRITKFGSIRLKSFVQRFEKCDLIFAQDAIFRPLSYKVSGWTCELHEIPLLLPTDARKNASA